MRLAMMLVLAVGVAAGAAAVAMSADTPAKDAPKAATDAPKAPADKPAPVTQTAPGWPEKYKGTPYKGVPQEIPGRVELENYDEGGLNVGFNTQHHEGDSSGKAYREGVKPQICITNGSPADQDKFADGKRYPADQGESYYIGYTRPGDWVQCTVNVKKAGVYRVKTTAASEPKKITFSLSFNGTKKLDVNTEGTGSYHVWKVYDNLGTVKLDAGLQVMKFQIGSEPHMNYDFLEFVLDEKATAEAK